MLHSTPGTSDIGDSQPRIIIFYCQDVWSEHQYKVNIYALVQESPDITVESKELHEKILLTDGAICVYSEELERLSRQSSRGSNN